MALDSETQPRLISAMPKTFTATLSKDGRQLIATVRYEETSWPDSVTFQ